MMDLLISIPLGVVLELLVFAVLHRLAGLAAKPSALIIALSSLSIYLPYAFLRWPGGDVVSLHLAVYLVTAYALGLIFSSRESRFEQNKDRSWFHWGPAVILSFFVILILFDATLVVISDRGLPKPVAEWLLPTPAKKIEVHSAFPGTVARDYQKKESLYNEYLNQVERQRARGWQIRKGWLDAPRARQDARFQVVVVDKYNQPLMGARVVGDFLRPSNTDLDQHFQLAEVSPGVYRQALILPAPGNWDVVLKVTKDNEVHEIKASTRVQQ